jgi:hypothetical protein
MTARTKATEHSDTLSTRDQLARWTGQAEDTTGERQQFVTLLTIQERADGLDHPDTLKARADLATWARAPRDPGPVSPIIMPNRPRWTSRAELWTVCPPDDGQAG